VNQRNFSTITTGYLLMIARIAEETQILSLSLAADTSKGLCIKSSLLACWRKSERWHMVLNSSRLLPLSRMSV
jgi:ABC-type phosphate transport system permease subunit